MREIEAQKLCSRFIDGVHFYSLVDLVAGMAEGHYHAYHLLPSSSDSFFAKRTAISTIKVRRQETQNSVEGRKSMCRIQATVAM